MTSQIKRLQRLTKALIVSGALNFVFLFLLIFLLIRDKPPAPYFELKPAETTERQAPMALDRTNAQVIRQFRNLSFEQLVAKLSDTQLVENGYTQRDIALACLVALHHFDLQRALLGMAQPEQQRVLAYGRHRDGSPAELTIYPGLTAQQFDTIIHYANTEKWPLTSKGLFLRLRSSLHKQEVPDPSLVDAFLLTPEFLTVEMLFNRSDIPVEKAELLKVLYDGDWQTLAAFSSQQRTLQDLSPARRQWFLVNYVEHGSQAAAYLLLKSDGDFATRKLDDKHILTLLRLLSVKTPEAQQFALAQLTSPRSNAVWALAAHRLYLYAGEEPPDKFQHQAALERFVQKKTPAMLTKKRVQVVKRIPKTQSIKALDSKVYIVQEGDSLWKISRKFKVDINKLRKTNNLQSDKLKVGSSLKIP